MPPATSSVGRSHPWFPWRLSSPETLPTGHQQICLPWSQISIIPEILGFYILHCKSWGDIWWFNNSRNGYTWGIVPPAPSQHRFPWHVPKSSHQDLVAGWAYPLKTMSSSVGMMTFPTEWKVRKFMEAKPPTRDWDLGCNISWGDPIIHLKC